ncbi:transcriptional regulator with XRE-family HTH domain [Actinoalloteichus hoggarensis]|uniref:Putative sporulation protein n=1 Tax=Actinoalloteichus hoggarensis TaxID=1470176 RepID=A0A221VVZ8_9PSEU|nr:helix-turn-helix transcriptional regulator [Actinoalloteichus hoggarensis]ASO17720.1 Putative sporulation protein [Actinoalloteichus hoggarensis]MBB5922846.1 transcriptional regulator with XRE-family HTH domain [Actinoalloteichus hoggarensis]
MNTIGSRSSLVTSEFWESQEMREALLKREISTVYKLLRKNGISQRQIAAATGQSQSEVSEILKGRQVMAYDVLVRIADGLGVPRGFMGLAYDEGTAIKVVGTSGDPQSEEDESVKRRKFLAHAAAVTVGAAVFGEDEGWAPASDQTPIPGRIGVTDVRQIEAATSALRSLDSRHGGGFCRDAVIAQLRWAQQLLSAQRRDGIENRLFVAIGDLHNLAGWTSFDTGLIDSARGHFSRALEFARRGGDDSLVANVLYRTGRLYLHHEEPNEALKLFQLGQMAAQNTGSQLTTAVLCANEAWAYAKLGMERPAKNLVNMAKDMFERSERTDPPGWVRFFDETDLYAMIGAIHTELATKDDADPKHSRIAINSLTRAINDYGGVPTRNVAFQCTMLALNHLIEGDIDQGASMGALALDASEHVRSKRVFDRMRPLEDLAQKRSANPMSRELAERIRSHRVA